MAISLVENGTKLESSVDLSQYFVELKKHWLKLLSVTVVVTGLSIPFICSMTSEYVSTATVLLKAKEDNVSPIENVETYDSTQAEYYPTQYDLIQSRVVLAEAVKLLKLNDNPDFNGESDLIKKDDGLGSKLLDFIGLSSEVNQDQFVPKLTDDMKLENAIDVVQKNLTVSGVRLTQLVKVSYQSPSPQLAKEIANGVVEAYKIYTINQKRNKTVDAEQWNNIQISYLKNEIDKKKHAMDVYLKDHGLLTYNGIDGFETEQMSIVANRLADAVQKRAMAQADYELVKHISSTNLSSVANLSQISNHPQLQDLKIALIQARRKLSELQKRYGPKYSQVIEAKAEITAIQQQTDVLLQGLKAGIYDNYQAAVRNENEYKKLLSIQKNDFTNITAKRDKYNDLKADLDKTQELYQELYKRTQEQKISAKYEEADVVLYDPAVLPVKPIKPNKPLFVIMVMILTLVISVVFTIVKAALNNKVLTLSDVERKLGLSKIGEVPLLIGVNSVSISKAIYAHDTAVEMLLGMKNTLQLKHKKTKVLGITSSISGEGSTLIASMLASIFAIDKKVLLLDLNYRKSGLSDQLLSTHSDGFAEWVYSDSKGAVPYIVKQDNGVEFLNRGNVKGSPLQFLMQSETQLSFQQLAQHYDMVIVDLPAISEGQDALVVADFIDSLLVTVAANQADVSEIKENLERLAIVNSNIIGAVLNKVSDENVVTEEVIRFLSDSER